MLQNISVVLFLIFFLEMLPDLQAHTHNQPSITYPQDADLLLGVLAPLHSYKKQNGQDVCNKIQVNIK